MANHLTATIRSATVLMTIQVQAWMVWMLLLLHSSAVGPSAPSGGAEWSKAVEVHSYISMLIQVVWTLHGIAASPLSQKIPKKYHRIQQTVRNMENHTQ